MDHDFIKIAHEMADGAGEIARKYYRGNVGIETKSDNTPVTIADKKIEHFLRSVIQKHFPDHGILGEEGESVHLSAENIWVLDPIDGTKAFVTGKPTFGTLISLVQNEQPVLGIIDQPITHERWVAFGKEKSLLNGQPIKTRRNIEMSDVVLYASAPDKFRDEDAERFVHIKNKIKWDFYTGDCYAFGLLALGLIDVVIETGLAPYDYCAVVPVIKNAGGFISDWKGNELGLNSNGTVIAAGDEKIYRALLEILA